MPYHSKQMAKSMMFVLLWCVPLVATSSLRRWLGLPFTEVWVAFTLLSMMALFMGGFIVMTRATGRIQDRLDAARGCLCYKCGTNLEALGDSGRCPRCRRPFEAKTDATLWRLSGFVVPDSASPPPPPLDA